MYNNGDKIKIANHDELINRGWLYDDVENEYTKYDEFDRELRIDRKMLEIKEFTIKEINKDKNNEKFFSTIEDYRLYDIDSKNYLYNYRYHIDMIDKII